jgi:putative glutamine amidotransferase
MTLLQGALQRDLPVLGICGGEQLLAVVLGGTLIQHIPDAIAEALPHEQSTLHSEPGHAVKILSGTLLERIVGTATMQVNTSHHQAVRSPGEGIINAVAPDGVIEGIEDPARKFCLEYLIDPGDTRIFAALIAAANG